MKLVKRDEFLKLPVGTIYAKGKANCFPSVVCVKEDTLTGNDGKAIDWFYWDFTTVESENCGELVDREDAMLQSGASYPIEQTVTRDGCFEDDDIFLIYEKSDLEVIRESVNKALAQCPPKN